MRIGQRYLCMKDLTSFTSKHFTKGKIYVVTGLVDDNLVYLMSNQEEHHGVFVDGWLKNFRSMDREYKLKKILND